MYNKNMKEKILTDTVKYLLEYGISNLSLRPLAKSMGTSDRMILYYFKNKEELVSSAVKLVAEGIISLVKRDLERLELKSETNFIDVIWNLFIDPKNRNATCLFFEIDILMMREPNLYGETAKYLMSEWNELIKQGLIKSGLTKKVALEIYISISSELTGLFLLAMISDEKKVLPSLNALKNRINSFL